MVTITHHVSLLIKELVFFLQNYNNIVPIFQHQLCIIKKMESYKLKKKRTNKYTKAGQGTRALIPGDKFQNFFNGKFK